MSTINWERMTTTELCSPKRRKSPKALEEAKARYFGNEKRLACKKPARRNKLAQAFGFEPVTSADHQTFKSGTKQIKDDQAFGQVIVQEINLSPTMPKKKKTITAKQGNPAKKQAWALAQSLCEQRGIQAKGPNGGPTPQFWEVYSSVRKLQNA